MAKATIHLIIKKSIQTHRKNPQNEYCTILNARISFEKVLFLLEKAYVLFINYYTNN